MSTKVKNPYKRRKGLKLSMPDPYRFLDRLPKCVLAAREKARPVLFCSICKTPVCEDIKCTDCKSNTEERARDAPLLRKEIVCLMCKYVRKPIQIKECDSMTDGEMN